MQRLIFLALPTPPGDDGSADLKYMCLGVCNADSVQLVKREVSIK